jgi:putative transposase
VFAFIETEKANHAVTRMCRLLGVSPSGYYAWVKRPPSARAVSDAALSARIRAIQTGSRGTYGAPRIHAELRAEDVHCSRKRVARLLRAAGLQECHRRSGARTTRRNPDTARAPDLVRRDFTAIAPDRLWVADITYLPTWMGFLSLAIALDAYRRRIIGWAMADHLRTELVIEAVDIAV